MSDLLDDINFDDDRKEGQPTLSFKSKVVFGLNVGLLPVFLWIALIPIFDNNIQFSLGDIVSLFIITIPVIGLILFLAEWSRSYFYTIPFSTKDKLLMSAPIFNILFFTIGFFIPS